MDFTREGTNIFFDPLLWNKEVILKAEARQNHEKILQWVTGGEDSGLGLLLWTKVSSDMLANQPRPFWLQLLQKRKSTLQVGRSYTIYLFWPERKEIQSLLPPEFKF